MTNETKIKVFSGSSNVELAEKICRHLNISLGKSNKIVFSDGNIYVKILEGVRDKDIYLLQTIGKDPNNEFMELLFWIDAFKRSSANSITVIMPYFGYAKADKKDEPRVSIRARVCADCLEAMETDHIITMDLHSAQIQGFFKKPVDHLYAANLFCEHIRGMNLTDAMIVSPDEGFAKRARYYSKRLDLPLAICCKQRTSHDEKAEIMDIIGNTSHETAVIVDDFTTTCSTLAETARFLSKRGVQKIYAFTSHALLSEKLLKNLEDSPLDKLITTDTIRNQVPEGCRKVEILSVSNIFAQAIRIIHNKESLSMIFE